MDKLVVSVFGDSGTGRTSMSRAVAREMGEASVCAINGDFFLSDRNGRPLWAMTCDVALLESVVAQPVGTLCHYPDYDFTAFRRRALKGPLTFRLRPIVLIDQIHPFPKADVFIHLDMPFDAAVERVLQRDPPDWEWRALLAERSTEIASVRDSAAVKKLSHRLVVDATHPVEESLMEVVSFIKNAWDSRMTTSEQAPGTLRGPAAGHRGSGSSFGAREEYGIDRSRI